jgi:translation initiation factor 2 subunit 1
MLLKKKGFPEEDELVLCTVTKIFHHGVFVDMDEYGTGGMIHISEVSPGRIRNIRDFVKEGKKVVCKVLRVDQEKGHVDLSLRRVNERQKKEKINEIKQEQKVEKIIEFAAKDANMDFKMVYGEVAGKVLEHYGLMNTCFEDVLKGNITLEGLGVDKEISEILTAAIKERMKPTEVFVEKEMKLIVYDANGVDIIKKALANAQGKGITILYEGGGAYRIRAVADEYKDAERSMEKVTGSIVDFMDKAGGDASFIESE